jgi:hypothetical protein
MACFAGCASIAGLDGITEQSCAPNCGTVDSGVADNSTGNDTGSDTLVQGDTTMGNDSTADTSSGDTGSMDTSIQDSNMVDTFVWDGPPFMDSPFDSGCGDLNTTTHCGACPDTCASTGASQTSAQCCSAGICPGSTNGSNDTCVYTCANGYLDCNASVPPDSDGCECHVPGATASQCCSGGGCPITHNNGLAQFWDCQPAGSYDAQLAVDACVAFVGAANAASCTQGDCISPDGAPDGDLVVCATGTGSTDCICWTYSGPNSGYFHDPHMAPANCFCAAIGSGDTQYH